MFLALAIASLPLRTEAAVEPQPLPEGVPDTGINVLLDSSHQFSFFGHWGCQDALRNAGHRVTGSQASLHRALVAGTPVRVREQGSHAWGTLRPFVQLPAPDLDVVYTYQHAEYQPYLDEERAALRRFVEGGGGLVAEASAPSSPLARLLGEYGARLVADAAEVSPRGEATVEGLGGFDFPRKCRVAEFSPEWRVLLGDGATRGCLASRDLGDGIIVCLTEPQLLHRKTDDGDRPNGELLSWMVTQAAGGGKTRDDERRVPWEYGGLGGALYPDNETVVAGVRVLYSDNQLPGHLELVRTKVPEVLDRLQKMLPTPPNPGEAYYINLAAGDGGGWAENAVTPKMAGTISMDHNGILSVLAHELAHTMYGPEATDGTPGCGLPGWFSEAHAGWFQRKIGRDMGFGQGWPYHSPGLAKADPLLNAVDLANVKDGQMGLAWEKAWLIWSILDARYGADWYPKWLGHVHRKYNDPQRSLSMDEYLASVSESVGEDVAPLFERFGTTVTTRTELPPIGAK
ncbi:MAG: hypothetical protein FJX74_04450 [Armatimonadetes bacterium]|nr:hypothetical protein [Armatimonadota bacterium]